MPSVFARRLLLACALAAGVTHAAPPAPRVVAPVSYTVQTAELLDFDRLIAAATDGAPERTTQALRSTERVLAPRKEMITKFDPDALLPGRAYVLKVRATVKGSKPQQPLIAVFFRENSKNEIYRSYRLLLPTGTSEKELVFTAPAYTKKGAIIVAPKDNDVRIEQLSLKMREPVVLTEPITSTDDSHPPPGYTLVFNDEFNGSELDRNKWFTRYIYENGQLDHLQSEKQRFRDNDNHVVKNGALSLVARKSDKPGLYDSGMIRSDWTTRYGYFEARVKVPDGKGVFPAFWLNPDAAEDGHVEWPPEIDIFEFAFNLGEEKRDMVHSGVIQQRGSKRDFRHLDPAFNTKWSYWKAPYNFDEGWHTIGAEWTPDSVTTYIDGRKIVSYGYEWKHHSGKLAGPAHVLLNLAIGGDWAGKYGIDDAAFPQALQIDWVRVYKKPE
jgi:beta-glucanase (GH16 family)